MPNHIAGRELSGSATRRCEAPGFSRMRELAERYPELASFTPDATLYEIKAMHGLNSLEEVLELGRRRRDAGVSPRGGGRVAADRSQARAGV